MMGLGNLSNNLKLTMDERLISVYMDNKVLRVITANKNGFYIHNLDKIEVPLMDTTPPGEKDGIN